MKRIGSECGSIGGRVWRALGAVERPEVVVAIAALIVTILLGVGSPVFVHAQPAEGTGESTVAADEPVPIPEASDRVERYHQASVWVWIGNYVMVVLVSVIVLFTGLSARMRHLAYKIGRFWPVAVLLYLLQFVVIDFVITLPFNYWAEAVMPSRFGLAEAAFGVWLVEGLTTLPGAIVFIFVLMLALYGLMRLSPRYWWLWVGLAFFPLNYFGRVDAFDFRPQSPMEDRALAAELQQLGEEAGFESVDVYQVPGNDIAVPGLISEPDILVGDQIDMEPGELRFVAARELALRRLHVPIKYNLMLTLLAIVTFFLLHRLGHLLVRRFRHVWKFDELKSVASWPLFPPLFNILFLLVAPVDTAFSRHLQYDADRFALELTRENRAAARHYADQTEESLFHPRPGPIYTALRAVYPPIARRVELANAYRPWETGQPLEFEHLFERGEASPRGIEQRPEEREDRP